MAVCGRGIALAEVVLQSAAIEDWVSLARVSLGTGDAACERWPVARGFAGIVG